MPEARRALFVPDFFSTFGTVLGVGAKAGYLDEDAAIDALIPSLEIIESTIPTLPSPGASANGRLVYNAIAQLLQLLQVLCEGWLRDIELLGCLGEILVLCNT